MTYDHLLLQEWTLQSTDGQPVTLTFNSFDVGAMLPAPSNGSSYIWSPNYPNSYDENYAQVKQIITSTTVMFLHNHDYLLQEWTLQSTDGQPVTLTFNSFDVGTLLPASSNLSSYIWSPNYPNDYDTDYQQVKSLLSTMKIMKLIL